MGVPVEVVFIVGLVTFFGILFGLMFSPARIRVRFTQGQLVVEPRGLDKIWCVHGSVRLARNQVAGVRAAERRSLTLRGLRLPGTYFPGLIIAGSYGVGARRVFWDVRRAQRLLVIDCVPDTGAGYRQLVLEVPDPDSAAATLQRSLDAHVG